jgi:hypothetical protein
MPDPIVPPPPAPEDQLESTTLSVDATAQPFSTALQSLFATLRELYVYCEANGRADIGNEVVDALTMCRQDFSVLVERIRSSSPKGSRLGSLRASPRASPRDQRRGPLSAQSGEERSPTATRPAAGAAGAGSADASAPFASSGANGGGSSAPESGSATGSPLHGTSSPLAHFNSPESNSRMLVALESLELEELQEAARYFEQTSAPGKELLPRREHERLFLERAAAEGREAPARRCA